MGLDKNGMNQVPRGNYMVTSKNTNVEYTGTKKGYFEAEKLQNFKFYEQQINISRKKGRGIRAVTALS